MRSRRALIACVLAAAAASAFAAPALAATCQTDGGQTCPSAMPPGGYCQCNVHGRNVDGTIVSTGSQRSTAKSFQPEASTQQPGRDRGRDMDDRPAMSQPGPPPR